MKKHLEADVSAFVKKGHELLNAITAATNETDRLAATQRLYRHLRGEDAEGFDAKMAQAGKDV